MIGLARNTFRRAREERLPQMAGSLTFSTVLSLAPLLAVSFALFTHIRLFRGLGQAIQEHLLTGVLPQEIARPVLKYLGHFAANAGGLTWVGFLFVVATALALVLTVENTFNRIWQVKASRPVHRRVALYVAALVLGPPLLGASLWATSYLQASSSAWVRGLPPEAAVAVNLIPVLFGMLCLAALFYFAPNAQVRRRDALLGGLLAAIAFELGKRGFAAYLRTVPTYRTVYGAFAVVPVFLVWVYFSWLVTLTAALVTANLGPGGRAKPARVRIMRRQNP